MKLSDISIIAFIQEYGLKNEKGDPIEFKQHKFLYDIYTDESQLICVMKPAQVGASTMDVIKTLYDAKKNKIDIIYTLPTDNDVQIFVGGKVNRIIAQNPILQQYTKDKDSIEQKQINDSMVYFRGTWTAKAAIMVSADRLVHDEVDSSKQDVVKQYQARLQHSKYKQIHIFSHPSIPGEGVDVYWNQSDQKHWVITCPHCKQRQYLSWPESIDKEKKIYICKACQGKLSNEDRRNGNWIAMAKGKYSGYWISLLMAPWVSAEEIIEKSEDPKTTEEFFYNKVLGLPYVGSGNLVSKDLIFRNLTTEINKQDGNIVIGVDPGVDIRYVIGNAQGLFYYGESKDYEVFRQFLKKWKKAKVVVDQGGDIIGQRKLREEFPGRVFLAHYKRDRADGKIFRWGTGINDGDVYVDRNKAIQLVIDELADKRLPLQGTESDWWDYYLHWSHIYRTQEEDALGVERWVWKRSDRDDWVHATVYFRAGMDKFRGEGYLVNNDEKVFEGTDKGILVLPNETQEW